MMKTICIFSLTVLLGSCSHGQTLISFPSGDGLTVSADVYLVNDTLPYMVLCHQAGFSRGEYKETASKFSKLGYNCLAIDQRSGEQVNGIKNETAAKAKAANKSTTYLDAEQDILAALNYAYTKSGKKIVLVGSSYSASLALKIATTDTRVKAVIAFSPGEYFGTGLNLKDAIKNISVPGFVTSSKEEASELGKLTEGIPSKSLHQFIPGGAGDHGSKALWENHADNAEYWKAVLFFMKSVK